jgi:hypothetical protein
MIMDYHRGNREIHGIPNQAVLNLSNPSRLRYCGTYRKTRPRGRKKSQSQHEMLREGYQVTKKHQEAMSRKNGKQKDFKR